MRYKTLIILVVTAVMTLPVFSSGAFAERQRFTKGEMDHAKAVHALHAEDLLRIPGVRGVGIGEHLGKPGILVLVDDESRIPHIPEALEDLSYVTLVVGEITAHGIELGTSGGNSLICSGYCSGGTVGFKVCDNASAGVSGIVTNNHVGAAGCPNLCPNNAPLGTNFFVPGVIDTTPVCSTTGATAIGKLNRFVPLVLNGTTINYADAAFVQSTDPAVSNIIAGLGAQNNTVAAAYVGQPVCKSGRTSGVTCGTVTGINLTINVNYGSKCGTAKFSNAVMYKPTAPYTVMSQSGDSGSPVVVAGTNAAVALNFAGDQNGNGFGNLIGDVLSGLNISLCDSASGTTTQYQLTTSVNPVGGGSVNPDCSSGCWFDSGVSPSLTAIANAGYTFSSWSGAISSTVNPTTVTMNGPITITANFIGTTSLPNLTPYQPAGWSDKIVVSNRRGTSTDSSPLYSTNTLYVDWAVLNNGTAATNKTFYTRLYLDGVQKASWYYSSTLSPNYYTYIRDYPIGRLSKGTHTIQIITDSTGVLPESNESDNMYTKTITVK